MENIRYEYALISLTDKAIQRDRQTVARKHRHIHMVVYTDLFISHSVRAEGDTQSIFKRSLPSLDLEFSFYYTGCLTKAEKLSLPNDLLTPGRRIGGFKPFPGVLVLCETQSNSSRN